VPVLDAQAFVFTTGGRAYARARTLKEFTDLLATLPSDRLVGHVQRHDFSRWIAEVFRDPVLADEVRTDEHRIDAGNAREVADAIAQAIRARYATAASGIAAA
jgi:hypothetical protein